MCKIVKPLISFWWFLCGKLAEYSYFTAAKVRALMTTNTETMVNPVDIPIKSLTRELATIEENQTLRHVMAQFWEAWANG